MRRGALGVVFVFALVAMGMSAQPSLAAEPKILKIGAADSLTGWMAAGEQPTNDGAKLAVAWINDKGGITIKGVKYKLQLVTEDAKSSPEGMAAACTKLVEKEKVKFIIGGVNPVMNIAASSVTEEAGVMRLAHYTCGNPDEFDPKFSLTYFANSSIQAARPMLAYVREKYPNAKGIALSHPGDGGEKYRVKNITPIAKEYGFDIVFSAEWPGETVDFTPFVKKALAAKPDLYVFTDGWAYHAGAQIKALRGLGFNGPVASFDSEIVSEVLAITGPEMIEGYSACSWELFDPNMKPVFKNALLPRVIKSGNSNPWQAWGWQTLWTMVQMIESAQSLDPVAVSKNVAKIKTIETLYGPARIGGEKTFGMRVAVCPPQAIFISKNGKPVFVRWVDTYVP
jgi:ABC-type branched-subunit amino acid transport system substrate-binding protein